MSFINSSFIKEKTHSYHLLIKMDNDNVFFLCATEHATNKCMYWEVIEGIELFSNHHFLKTYSWKTIKVVVPTFNFTLLPLGLYIEDYKEEYLSLVSKLNPKDRIFDYKHRSTNIVSIWSLTDEINKSIKDLFLGKKITLIPESSSFLQSCIIFSENKKKIDIFFKNRFCYICVSTNCEILFFNKFEIKFDSDCAYYILAIQDELILGNDFLVTLWGDIEINSSILNNLQEHIPRIKLGSKSEILSFSIEFDLLKTDHIDLFSSHFCD